MLQWLYLRMEKAYSPQQFEDEMYAAWLASGFFNPDNLPVGERYCNVLPPPNANGELHVGHTSGYVVMDFFGRYQRMHGKRVLLLPGKDHAGIQTQVVFEKKLKAERGIDRHDLGREQFYRECYDFCLDRAGYMRTQEKKIGLSADWSREKFTLDPELIATVTKTFVNMHRDGLIYRGSRIINWCPRCATALSDIEVEHTEQAGTLSTFRYSPDLPFAISSTRPETKLGDTAVAVHPDDERYRQYVGQTFTVDFVGVPLTLRVIADPAVDPAFGTGALGVTPAHSMIDAELGQRHSLPSISVITPAGTIADGFGAFSGLPVAEARAAIVAALESAGLLEKTETIQNNLAVCERCRTPIEQLVSQQWFVRMDHPSFSLKAAAREAITTEAIRIYPSNFKKTMLDWVEATHDWCISRQIWWGPRIPAWYRNRGTEQEEIVVSTEAPTGEGWTQDEDTLDTWFSSGQWAYTTLGYPDGADAKTFYPTDTMIMGRDLIFFWAFRMIIMSLYTTRTVPFKNLYFTGLVRDEQGRKMSKSKGNGIEPLEMIGKYGTDALRLSLLVGSTPGNDLNLGEQKIAGFRNFTNKLWNIARFIHQTLPAPSPDAARPTPVTLADRWLLARLDAVAADVTTQIESYNFSLAGESLRAFTWDEFADWYLEIAKVEGDKEPLLNYALNTLLKLWHPFMPFVTEAIWREYYGGGRLLMMEPWPASEGSGDAQATEQFTALQSVVSTVRNLRAEHKIEPAAKLPVVLVGAPTWLESQVASVSALTRASAVTFAQDKPAEQHISALVGESTVCVLTATAVDRDVERARLQKEITALENYRQALQAKLENTEFTAKAPPAVVAGEQQKHDEAAAKIKKLQEQLESV